MSDFAVLCASHPARESAHLSSNTCGRWTCVVLGFLLTCHFLSPTNFWKRKFFHSNTWAKLFLIKYVVFVLINCVFIAYFSSVDMHLYACVL